MKQQQKKHTQKSVISGINRYKPHAFDKTRLEGGFQCHAVNEEHNNQCQKLTTPIDYKCRLVRKINGIQNNKR